MNARCISTAILILGACGCAANPSFQHSPADQSAMRASANDDRSEPTEYLSVDVRVTTPGDNEIVSEREAKTGSHWKRRVCRTQAAAAQQRAASQEWLRTRGFSGAPTVVR